MRRVTGLFIFLFTLMVGGISPVYAVNAPEKAEEETVSKDSFDAYKELANTKLDAAKESLQKDIQNFTTRVDGQDKRVDQLNSEIDHSLAILGVLLVLAGVISFFSFRDTARKQAKEEVEFWFKKHEKNLADRKQHLAQELDGFKQQILELQEQVQTQARKIKELMQELENKLLNESDDLIKKMSASRQAHDSLKSDRPQLSQDEAALLAKAADKTQHKPESERSFADWNRLAFAANGDGKKELAIDYWYKATAASDVTDTQIAQTLVNIGATWEELQLPEKAVSVYDSLLQRFADSTVPGVHEQCATALVNKGLELGEKLGDPAGEVAVYDSLLQRFADSTIASVHEQCARALVSKGVMLGRLDDLAGAVACYDDLLARYSQSENPTIQEQCQSAVGNTAELLLVLGRHAEAIPRIRQVLARTDSGNQEYAIMPFLLWLAEADTTPDDMLTAIRALSPAVEFTWNWTDIRPLVDKLPEPRKTQAECFIAFFEKRHDIAMLEQCLVTVSN